MLLTVLRITSCQSRCCVKVNHTTKNKHTNASLTSKFITQESFQEYAKICSELWSRGKLKEWNIRYDVQPRVLQVYSNLEFYSSITCGVSFEYGEARMYNTIHILRVWYVFRLMQDEIYMHLPKLHNQHKKENIFQDVRSANAC